MQHSLNQPQLRPNKLMGQDNFLNTAKIHRLLNTPRGIRGNALEYVCVNTEKPPHTKSNKSGDDAKQSGSHRSRSLRRYNPGQVPRVYSQFRFIRTPLANSLKVYHNASTTGIKKLRGPSDWAWGGFCSATAIQLCLTDAIGVGAELDVVFLGTTFSLWARHCGPAPEFSRKSGDTATLPAARSWGWRRSAGYWQPRG